MRCHHCSEGCGDCVGVVCAVTGSRRRSRRSLPRRAHLQAAGQDRRGDQRVPRGHQAARRLRGGRVLARRRLQDEEPAGEGAPSTWRRRPSSSPRRPICTPASGSPTTRWAAATTPMRELEKACRAQPERRHRAVVARRDLPAEEGRTARRSRTSSRRCCSIPRTRRRCRTSASPTGRPTRWTEAEKYFLKAIELKPDQADFHFNLATVYRRQQKTQGGDRPSTRRPSSSTHSWRRRTTTSACSRAAEAQRRRDPASGTATSI